MYSGNNKSNISNSIGSTVGSMIGSADCLFCGGLGTAELVIVGAVVAGASAIV